MHCKCYVSGYFLYYQKIMIRKESVVTHIQHRCDCWNIFIPRLVESVHVEPKDIEEPTNCMHPLIKFSHPALQTYKLRLGNFKIMHLKSFRCISFVSDRERRNSISPDQSLRVRMFWHPCLFLLPQYLRESQTLRATDLLTLHYCSMRVHLQWLCPTQLDPVLTA